jgi:hypothetical protein
VNQGCAQQEEAYDNARDKDFLENVVLGKGDNAEVFEEQSGDLAEVVRHGKTALAPCAHVKLGVVGTLGFSLDHLGAGHQMSGRPTD